MKKLLISVFIMIICTVLTSCELLDDSIGKTDNLTVKIGESSKFSQKEINNAVKCVKRKFISFEGCELTEIEYDEKTSDSAIASYMQSGKGSENGVSEENVIILTSSFKTDEHGGDGSLEPNEVYSGWSWTLIRDSKNGRWTVDDWGVC